MTTASQARAALPDDFAAASREGLTTRDIAEWLEQSHGPKIRHETVANVTDSVYERATPPDVSRPQLRLITACGRSRCRWCSASAR